MVETGFKVDVTAQDLSNLIFFFFNVLNFNEKNLISDSESLVCLGFLSVLG